MPRSSRVRALVLAGLPWLLLLALVLRSPAVAALAAGWAAMLLLAQGASRRRLRGVTLRREVYANAFEGDAVAVDLIVENRSPRTLRLLELGDVFGPGLADRQRLLECGPLPPRRRRRLRYETQVSRDWGIYPLGPLCVAGADPLGLFPVERPQAGLDAFAVFPRVYEVAGLERLGARPTLAPQDTTLARPGQSAAYMGVRDYRPEDGLRRIHWPATARLGTPAVKEFELDREPQFALFLDLDRRHRAGTGRKSTLEYVARTAASLLWSATRRGQAVEVVAESRHPVWLPPGRGEAHLAHCLSEMIRVRLDGTTRVLELVERHRPALAEGSTAAILFGSTGVDLSSVEETLAALREHGARPLLVFVNSDSFVPVDKWPLPRERMEERCREVRAFLRDHGIPGAVLGVEHELAEELARPELFEATP